MRAMQERKVLGLNLDRHILDRTKPNLDKTKPRIQIICLGYVCVSRICLCV